MDNRVDHKIDGKRKTHDKTKLHANGDSDSGSIKLLGESNNMQVAKKRNVNDGTGRKLLAETNKISAADGTKLVAERNNLHAADDGTKLVAERNKMSGNMAINNAVGGLKRVAREIESRRK